MSNYDAVIVTALFINLLVWEYAKGLYQKNKRPIGEWLVDGISFLQLGLIKPTVVFIAFSLAAFLFPSQQNSLTDLPFWLGFLIVFLPDDLSHYWAHRLAHGHPAIWGLHRTHHTATVYQTSIAFRDNGLWFVVMPGFWWSGLMVYFGLIEQVLLSATFIGAHNVWLHNGSTRDLNLYENRYTRVLMRALEYVINSPALHRSHHGLGKNGVPMGNYGQTLFIWDVLFGTATFNRGKLPEYYGTYSRESMQHSWQYQLWAPLVKKRPLHDSQSAAEVLSRVKKVIPACCQAG